MKYLQLFQKRVITRKDNLPYLLRWTLLGLGQDSSWFSIKIHKILISDEECLHDHPWAFISIILKGGYMEYTRYKKETWDAGSAQFSDKNGCIIFGKVFKAGNILYRPANWAHSLQLKEPAWTLVFTFRKVQPWGFFTRKGWILHKDYIENRDC